MNWSYALRMHAAGLIRPVFRSLPIVFVSAMAIFAQAVELPRGGINLTGYHYWNTAFAFNNVAGMADSWISAPANGSVWDDGRPIALTPNGFPQSLAADQIARSLVFTHNGARYPTGQYTLTWDGTGQVGIPLSSEISVVNSNPGSVVYQVNQATDLGLLLEITQTDSQDPVQNVQLTMPGSAGTEFNPDYGADLAHYGVVRYMDWNATNDHTVSQWPDRSTPDQFHRGSDRGLSYETQIRMSNQLSQDMWVTVPHLADDNYVQQLAHLIDTQLDPNLRVWVEYSNEVWNAQFAQYHYAHDVLRGQFGVENTPEAYALRAAEMFDIFANQIQDDDRVVRVIGGQSHNPWQLETALAAISDGGKTQADVGAVAAYFSLNDAQTQTLYDDYLADTVDLDAVFDDLRTTIDAERLNWEANATATSNRNLPLVAYEGGQHMVARTAAQTDDDGFTQLLTAINRDPRMGEMYDYMLDQWHASGGRTLAFFNDVQSWGRFGSWGLKEDYLDDDSPKFLSAKSNLENPGDFNRDGNFDSVDVDRLVAEIAAESHGLKFDLTGDGRVDLADRDAWLAAAGQAHLPSGNSFLLGDANLDGTVDGQDFLVWNDHKFTATAAWSAGDFNADGAIDGQDFLTWNENKFQSADNDQVVPEPASGCLFGSLMLFGCGFVRATSIRSQLQRVAVI